MLLKTNIHNRLALVLWGAALLAFIVTGTGLALFHNFTLEQRIQQIMEPYAHMIAVGTDTAVAFEDPVRAQEILDTLKANFQITEADIILGSGQILARFNRKPSAKFKPLPDLPDGVYFNGNTAELLETLPRGARLRLVMSLSQLSQQTQQMFWLFGSGVLVLLIVTLAQLIVLRRTIVGPISSLTEATERIRAKADYQHRVPASGSDEVAQLGRNFNTMMAAIQEREDDLRRLSQFQRTILDNLAYAVISTDSDGLITSFNPAAEILLGYSAEEVIGKKTPELWHDPGEMTERALKLTEELGETISPGFSVFTARPQRNLREENEWTFIRKDGERIPVNLSITALWDENSHISGFVGLTYDLTERKHTQYQLQLLTFALDRVKETIVLMNENDPHFLYVNESAAETLGYSREELTGGMDVFDIDPDWSPEMWKAFWPQLCIHRRMQFETAHRTRNGRRFPVEVTANYFEFDGKIYNLGICRDITERKQSEQERQATLRYFESMDRINLVIQGAVNIEQLMVGVLDTVLELFACDRAWLCYPCDPAAATWRACMERTVPEYPGALIQNLEVPLDAGTVEVYRTVLSANEPVWFGPGSKHPFSEVLAKQFNIQSQLSMAIHPKVDKPYMFGLHQCSYPREWTAEEIRLFQEIGRRLADGLTSIVSHRNLQESEARYRRIVDTASEGIWVLGSDGITTFANARMADMLGYTCEEMLGRPMTDFMFEQDAADHREKMDRHRQGLSAYYERRLCCKNGQVLWTVVSATAILNEEQKFQGSFAMFTDINQRKHAEDELRNYKDQLEETIRQRTAELMLARDAAEAANKAKSVFLANMSHELRTPLNAILGFSSIMLKNPLFQENDRRNIDIIIRSGEHLLTLINDVLEMAKIEAGRVQLDETPFDLGAMVRDVANMMQVRAVEKGLQLMIDQSSEFPRCIIGDEARLRQVLINLVGNALKFTQQGSITIRLGTKKNRTSHLLIEVEDSGAGIAQEDQNIIFEPFVQLGHHADNKGTGLGLSITRQFVQLMNGHISLESIPGKGSLFRVDLPLKQAKETEISNLNYLKEKEVFGIEPGQIEYRILIAEDQLENQFLLANLMESVGLPYKVANDGKQAIEVFRSWKPHLIWMDRRMPVMDGVAATKIIRGLSGGKDVKIVAVTASAFAEQRAEMLDAGMDDFIRKPYRAYEIYQCLTRQLGVRFLYSQMPLPESESMVLTSEMLSVLPKDLCQDLENAVKSLESERIELIIERIAHYDQKLAKVLAQLNDNFDYPAILKALRSGESNDK